MAPLPPVSLAVRSCMLQALGVLAAASTAASMCAAQVLDGAVPDFQLNASRYLATFAMALVMALLTRTQSVRIPRQALPPLAGAVVANMLNSVSFYGSASFLPVGTSAGTFSALTVAWAAAWAAVRCRLTPLVGLAAALSILGVILVSQPLVLFKHFDLHRNPASNWRSPCRSTNDMTSFEYLFESNVTVEADNLPLQYDSEVHSGGGTEWIGYLILTAAGGFMVLGLEFSSQVQKHVESTALSTLWMSLSIIILSIVVSAIAEPMVILTDGFCISMVIIHALGASVFFISCIFLTKYLPSVVMAFIINYEFIFLMISQQTFMSSIHPGLGNWLEWLGTAVCLLGCVLGPVGDYIATARSKPGEYADLDNETPDDVMEKSAP